MKQYSRRDLPKSGAGHNKWIILETSYKTKNIFME